MSAQVAADLRAAAEVLKRDGWTQGSYHDGAGCHCVEGAMAAAVGMHVRHVGGFPEDAQAVYLDHDWWTVATPETWARRSAAEDFTLGTLGLDVDGLFDWNDEPGRTADEVIAVLEAAADAAEQQVVQS